MAGTEMVVPSNGTHPEVPKMELPAAGKELTVDVEKAARRKQRKSDASRRRKKSREPASRARTDDATVEAAAHRQRTSSAEAVFEAAASTKEGYSGRHASMSGSNGSGGALGFLSLIPTEYHAPPPASEKLRHTVAISARTPDSSRKQSPPREPEPLPDLSQGLTFGFMGAGGGERAASDDADCLQPESGEFDPQMAGEGWLKRRVKAGKWKDVWCTLNFNGVLKEHKDEEAEEAAKTIKVSLCTISKDALTRLGFRLKVKSKTLIYQAPDSEAFAMWLPSLAQYTHEMFTTLEIGSLSFPTIVCNQRCIIVRANREAERLLGYQMKEMVGRHLASLVAAQREDDSNDALLRCISKGSRVLEGKPVVRLTHLSGEPLELTMDLGRYTEAKHGDKYIIAFKLISNKKRLDLDAVRGVKIKWLTADEEVTNEDEFMKSQAKLHKFFGD